MHSNIDTLKEKQTLIRKIKKKQLQVRFTNARRDELLEKKRELKRQIFI